MCTAGSAPIAARGCGWNNEPVRRTLVKLRCQWEHDDEVTAVTLAYDAENRLGEVSEFRGWGRMRDMRTIRRISGSSSGRTRMIMTRMRHRTNGFTRMGRAGGCWVRSRLTSVYDVNWGRSVRGDEWWLTTGYFGGKSLNGAGPGGIGAVGTVVLSVWGGEDGRFYRRLVKLRHLFAG